jgi:hypothetical protein
MISILKFFENTNYKEKTTDNENEVISRTMLKIAVVSRHYRQKHGPEKMPKNGELWKCKVVKEINSGKNKGCFVVEPIERIADTDIVHLIPGWYDTKVVNGRLLIIPRKQNVNWIMPLTHKRIIAEENGAYCVIVTLDSLPVSDEPNIPFPEASGGGPEEA